MASTYALHFAWPVKKSTPTPKSVRHSVTLRPKYARERTGVHADRTRRMAAPLAATERPQQPKRRTPTARAPWASALVKCRLMRALPMAKVKVAARKHSPTRTAVFLVDVAVGPLCGRVGAVTVPAARTLAGPVAR